MAFFESIILFHKSVNTLLYFIVVISSIRQSFLTFCTIAPLTLNDLMGNFVNGLLHWIHLLAGTVKNSISHLAGSPGIFKRRKSPDLRFGIKPGLSYPVELLCRRCRGRWCRCRTGVHISLYLFLELCPVRQNVEWTHLVRVSRCIEIIYTARLSISDIEPVGMCVKMVDSEIVFLQQGCGKSCTIVLRLLICRIIRR